MKITWLLLKMKKKLISRNFLKNRWDEILLQCSKMLDMNDLKIINIVNRSRYIETMRIYGS